MSDEDLERIMAMSDEELKRELRAEGLDPDEVADDVRATLDAATAAFLARDREVVVRGEYRAAFSVEGYRRLAYAIGPREAELFEVRDVGTGSVNGGTIRTVVCRECTGLRRNRGDDVVQHHEGGCSTPAKAREIELAGLRRLRAYIGAIDPEAVR